MPRPVTDFRLWLVCSGGLLVLASIGFVVEARAGRHFWTDLAVAFGACAVIGWVVQDGLVRRGYRLTRPKPPDQAEDYEDRPGPR
jgi:hypothetical protein